MSNTDFHAVGNDYVLLDLNVFDDDGQVVDGTTGSATVAQISDIVDHATQLLILYRQGKSIEGVIAELDEAVVAADLMEAADSESWAGKSLSTEDKQLFMVQAEDEDSGTNLDLLVVAATAEQAEGFWRTYFEALVEENSKPKRVSVVPGVKPTAAPGPIRWDDILKN